MDFFSDSTAGESLILCRRRANRVKTRQNRAEQIRLLVGLAGQRAKRLAVDFFETVRIYAILCVQCSF